MDIPGLSTLYAILKRHIDRGNDILAQRKALADELMENCRNWSQILIATFDQAVSRWQIEGRDAAEKEIMEQEMDFMKLNYHSLKDTSPILLFLREDSRFEDFALSCANFYTSALDVKRLVYGHIESHPGHFVTERDVGIAKMVELWRHEVESMLHDVTTEHMRVKVIVPK
jgi:hypothetical protein